MILRITVAYLHQYHLYTIVQSIIYFYLNWHLVTFLFVTIINQLYQSMQLRLYHFFCTSKNYVNQFKVRSRLADFFKHIHPDQMAQAPTKIKDENLRSLKNFNSYLDSINQEKPIQGKLLKFYISEKTNNKSRKFFSFTLQLPPLDTQQAKMDETRAGKLIDDIVNALNSKFRQSRGILQGKKKEKVTLESQIKVETEEEKVQRMQETTGPFQSNFKRYIQQESLRQAINAKFMEAERQDLKLKLRQNMSFANTSTNKPMMWSRIVMEESGIYGDYQQILNNLIDPKLIYFSEDINLPEIEQFKRKLLPGELDRFGVRATQAVIQVCEQMQSYSPPLCLYVTTHYSATEIPGFLSVPYNFKPVELLEQFQQCKHIILQEREKYEQNYDLFLDLSKELATHNKIKVKLPGFKNNSDLTAKIITIKRLAKVKLQHQIQLNLFQHQDFKILCRQYKLQQEKTVHYLNSKLFVLISFKDQDMNQAIEKLQAGKERMASR